MKNRKLPIGLQTFREVGGGDYYYVDKTPFIRRLVDEGKHYFLSRPRRFGKSLFLDTLKELFEANEALFRGLAIHDEWNWLAAHPVLRLSFGSGLFASAGGLHAEVVSMLRAIEESVAITAHPDDSAPARLRRLIETQHEQTGRRVVVLVDEYDKPILDALESAPEVARANRDYLRAMYGVIKDCDAHLRFSFITGVSRFSKVSLFSGLNNLTDITLDPRYSTVCGYTEDDLDDVFLPEMRGVDRAAVRDWYNGYGWRGRERVYNPFDVLLYLRRREFQAWWFETGTPTFLIDTLRQRGVSAPELDAMVAGEDVLSTFDVDHIATEALLFQTGYLTITGETTLGGRLRYRLGYPNREVRQSLNQQLLRHLVQDASRPERHGARLYEILEANDFESLKELVHAFFASIPYEWYTSNDIARYEGYYASVFYAYFASLGLDITVEDCTNHGRVDMTVRFNGNVYVFEFKVVESGGEGSAMAQLLQRGYAEKYLSGDEPVHLIGVEFSKETRNVVAFEVQRA